MKRIAIFSDIHANLPALEAVLSDIDQHHPDAIYCLGDLVGYNVWPNEVVDLIQARNIPTIRGNYDEGVGNNSDDCGCAYKSEEEKANGKISISYTNSVMKPAQREYLRNLPFKLEFDMVFSGGETKRVLLVHGSPRKINEYLFEDRDDKSLLRLMRENNADLMFFGHTHKPWSRVISDEEKIRIATNTGSVGKPKDGDPRACWILLEADTEKPFSAESVHVRFMRCAYDTEKAAAAVEQSALPAVYATMIREAK